MEKPAKPKEHISVIALVISIVSKVGIPGAFAILLMSYATKAQYQEFIDTFILLHFVKNSIFVPYFVIFYVLLASGGTIFYYHRRMKLKDERIRILEDQVRCLQPTSKKTKPKTKITPKA